MNNKSPVQYVTYNHRKFENTDDEYYDHFEE